MKINTDYDGKRIRVEAEVPPDEIKEFLTSIGKFIAGFFREEKKGEKKVDGPKKGHSKKGGES